MATFVRTQVIEHDLGERGRFALRLTNPDVELRAVQGTTARVHVEFEVRASNEDEADEIFDRIQYRARKAEGVLEVSEADRAETGLGSIARLLGIGNVHVAATVTAEVPARAEIAYDGVSADLTSTGFQEAQQYRTVSGDMVITECGGSLRLNAVSGDVTLRATAPISLELKTVSGDASAFAPQFGEVRLVTVSGDVELEGPLAPGHRNRVETVSGDLSIGAVGGLTMEVRGLSTDVSVSIPHRSEGSRERRRYIIGDGAAELFFSSMSGDVSVRSARRFTDPPPPPTPPTPPRPPQPAARVDEAEQLRILQALERGEIDVEEASRRLAGEGADA